MRVRSWLALGGVLVAAGCDSGGETDGPGLALASRAESGRYEMTGVTIDVKSGEQRPIAGRVILKIDDDHYTTHFELTTVYPGTERASAHVVGTGEGAVQGGVLDGEAHVQLVLSSAPGVDVGFAFVPRAVGPRIVSKAHAQFFADGSVRIELENAPEEGEDYRPTRTTLVGYRIEEP